MVIYNFQLIFEKDIELKIHDFAKEVNVSLDPDNALDSTKTPHITILKFELPNELSEESKEKIRESLPDELEVTLAGITFLPSNKEGVWVEISVLKSKSLLDLQKKFTDLIPESKILSGVGDGFRPHLTLNNVSDGSMDFSSLDPILLRATVKTYPRLSLAGNVF